MGGVLDARTPALQAKFKSFYTEWPQARQKIPYTLMQEMRIVPELPGYDELVEKLFFELMDGKLSHAGGDEGVSGAVLAAGSAAAGAPAACRGRAQRGEGRRRPQEG